jgi:uncharacterized protein (DUF983 family)
MRHYEDDPSDKQAEDVAAVLRGLVPCPRCGGAGEHIVFSGVSAGLTTCGRCCGERWVERDEDDD